MKIINPSVELMNTGLEKELTTPEQLIEKVGRTCYKSEDKITPDSSVKFVGNLVKRGHEAMIEHWSPIFRTDPHTYDEFVDNWEMLMHNGNLETDDWLRPYLRFTDWDNDGETRCIISGNMRAWRDYSKACMKAFGFLPAYLHAVITGFPTFFPEFKDCEWDDSVFPRALNQIGVNDLVGEMEHGVHHDVTVKFICDRGVSHEIVRHRTASFAQESTRYCNYGQDKFDQCITVIEPQFIKNAVAEDNVYILHSWEKACCVAEAEYFNLLNAGCTPQEARSVLPNSLKTEVIMTANLYNWAHFFELRCAPDAHPDIQVVANMAKDLFNSEVYPHV